MSVMIDQPEAYFRQWIPERLPLLEILEKEALNSNIPIVGPVVGHLLYMLARLIKARNVVELGTAVGYSAIFIGQACRINQGKLITFEIDSEMAERAKINIANSGLTDVVQVNCADVFKAMQNIEPSLDMIFIDIEKKDYIQILPECERRLGANGLLVADNTGFKDAHLFNQFIHMSPNWESVNLWSFLPGHSPEYDGICIAMKR